MDDSMGSMHDNILRRNNNNNGPRSQQDGSCYLKLLVSHAVAGAIIGPKGSTITKLSQDTGSAVRVSNSDGFFPGTVDRVVVLCGKMEEVEEAFRFILLKIRDISSSDSSSSSSSMDENDTIVLKVAVPNSAVSALIGRQGQTIKKMQEASGCRVQVSNRDEHNLRERVVMVTGSFDRVCQLAVEVFKQIQEDPNLKDHTDVNHISTPPPHYYDSMPLSGGGWPKIAVPPPIVVDPFYLGNAGMIVEGVIDRGMEEEFDRGMLDGYGYPPVERPVHLSQHCHIIVPVPDMYAGALIGRNGSSLQEMQQVSGARFSISDKGDFIGGTDDRRVTITGPISAVHKGHIYLLNRLNEIQLASQRWELQMGR